MLLKALQKMSLAKYVACQKPICAFIHYCQFGVNAFERSVLCSPRLNLFDKIKIKICKIRNCEMSLKIKIPVFCFIIF